MACAQVKCNGRRGTSTIASKLDELYKLKGSPVSADAAKEAASRAHTRLEEQRRLEQEAEDSKAEERAAKLMARKVHAGRVRKEHEMRIRAEAARRVSVRAMEAQAEEEAALRDIEAARQRTSGKGKDDDLARVMAFAPPPPLRRGHDEDVLLDHPASPC